MKIEEFMFVIALQEGRKLLHVGEDGGPKGGIFR